MFSIIKIVRVLKVVLIPFIYVTWLLLIVLLLGYIFPNKTIIFINTSLKFQIFNSVYAGSISEVIILFFLALSVTFVFLVCKLILNYYQEKIQRIILEPMASGKSAMSIASILQKYGTNIYDEYHYYFLIEKYIRKSFQSQMDLLSDAKEIIEFLEKNQKIIDENWQTNYKIIHAIFRDSLINALFYSISIRKPDFFPSWFTLLFLLLEKSKTSGVVIYNSWLEQLWSIQWCPNNNESPASFSLRLKENFHKASQTIETSLNEEELISLEESFTKRYNRSWDSNVMPNL